MQGEYIFWGFEKHLFILNSLLVVSILQGKKISVENILYLPPFFHLAAEMWS